MEERDCVYCRHRRTAPPSPHLEPLLTAVVVAPFALDGLHDHPRARVAKLLLLLNDVLDLQLCGSFVKDQTYASSEWYASTLL